MLLAQHDDTSDGSSGHRWLRRLPSRAALLVLLGWLLLVATVVLWGRHLQPTGTLNADAAPFQGRYRLLPRAVVPGAVVAIVGVALLPVMATRLRWRALPATAAMWTAVWALALWVWDGHLSLGSTLNRSHEYLPAVAAVGNDPHGFLTRFADDVAHRRLPVHVNGHPPLMVLVFWAWDRIGFSGADWAGALVVGAGASAVAAILITIRSLASEDAGRRAMPFLALGPFAITIATSADAFFTGVAAWATAALAVGIQHRRWSLLVVAAVLTGALPYLSYGLLPYLAVLLAVAVCAVRRHGQPRSTGGAARQWLPWLAVLAGLAVVPVAFTVAGFSWLEGVHATHRAWTSGKGDDRPYVYSLVADVAVLAVLVGPATAVAVVRRSPPVVAVIAAASSAAMLALAVSGVTRLEVERIWLPFAPWLVLLTASLPGRSRGWLALNALCAIVFELFVFDVW